MPGCLIAASRHNRPTILVYGGTIQAGVRHLDCPAMGFKAGDPLNIGVFGFFDSAGFYYYCGFELDLRAANASHLQAMLSRAWVSFLTDYQLP